MLDRAPTPSATLTQARRIAMNNGLRYVYTGNVYDPEGQSTYCHVCGKLLIGRDGYEITAWAVTIDGRCNACGNACAGVFEAQPGDWGSKRLPVRLAGFR
jgi:pyruvate formate lyase activating enzyme